MIIIFYSEGAFVLVRSIFFVFQMVLSFLFHHFVFSSFFINLYFIIHLFPNPFCTLLLLFLLLLLLLLLFLLLLLLLLLL